MFTTWTKRAKSSKSSPETKPTISPAMRLRGPGFGLNIAFFGLRQPGGKQAHDQRKQTQPKIAQVEYPVDDGLGLEGLQGADRGEGDQDQTADHAIAKVPCGS